MERLRGNSWRQTYRTHVLVLERFLTEAGANLTGEQAVYLAGMVARKLDQRYQHQIQDLLLEDPRQLDLMMRNHEPYIGQNAPVFTLSRINGEFLMTGWALDHSVLPRKMPGFRQAIAVRYFSIADFYARRVGNRAIADIMHFLMKEFPAVLDLLSRYRRYFAEHELPPRVTRALWKRFAREFNERNRKKERWERMGIDASRKQHIPKREFNAMLDYQSKN